MGVYIVLCMYQVFILSGDLTHSAAAPRFPGGGGVVCQVGGKFNVALHVVVLVVESFLSESLSLSEGRGP